MRPSHDAARGRPSHGGDALLFAAAGFAYFLAIKLHAWAEFRIHGELAEFESILWNAAHGHGLLMGGDGGSVWVQHASPILYALAPLAWLPSLPRTLLVVQALVAAAAVVPLHAVAMRLTGRRGVAALACAAYLASRVVHNGVDYDFHMEVFYPLAFFGAFWAFETKRSGWLAACLLLALSVKEDAAIVACGFGAWMWLRGARRAGAWTVAASAAWLALALGVLLPHARAAAPDGGATYRFARYWSDYGATMPEIARHLLDPRRHIEVLFTAVKVRKMFTLFAAFAFLPLAAGWATLFCLGPAWFLLFASSNPQLYGTLIYYGFLIVPPLFYCGLLAVRRFGRYATWAAALWLALTVANSRLFAETRPGAWGVPPGAHAATALLARVPADVPGAAQVDLVSHVPRRAWRSVLPSGLQRAQWLLFDLDGNPWPSTRERNRALADSLAADPAWRVDARRDGYLLLRRVTAPARP